MILTRENIVSVTPSDTQHSMHVGKIHSGNDKYGHFVVDEWYIWDRELSGEQVAQVYAAYRTGTDINQYSFWYSLNNRVFLKNILIFNVGLV